MFCNWLSKREHYLPCYDTNTWECRREHSGYHLPTEAQWERAAAWDTGGEGRHYRYGNGSDSISCSNANYNVINVGFCNPLGLSGHPHTAPVGLYALSPSPAGCFDMTGNVREWCNDWYDEEYYSNSPWMDPEGGSSSTGKRVQRGGGYADTGEFRSARRARQTPRTLNASLGFRVARY